MPLILGLDLPLRSKRAQVSVREGRGAEEVPAGEKMKIDNSRNL